MTAINFKHSKAIFILFLIVLGIIIYTSVFNSNIGNINITGNFLKSETNPNESAEIRANISMESLELDGVFERVVFTSVSEVEVEIGKANFKTKNGSKMILEDYDGEIVFTSEKIVSLDGDADSIETEGGSYEEETDVSLENLEYNDLRVDGVYIKKFDKSVLGVIDVGGKGANLKREDNLLIKKFQGTVSSSGATNRINFEGIAEEVKIGEGDFSWSF